MYAFKNHECKTEICIYLKINKSYDSLEPITGTLIAMTFVTHDTLYYIQDLTVPF